MSNEKTTTSQGGFMTVATVGTGAAIGGVMAVPAAGLMLGSVTQEATFNPVPLGPADKFAPQAGFNPVAAPFVDHASQPLVSSGLACVVNMGRPSHDWHRIQWEIRKDGNLGITQLWSVLIEGGKVHDFPVKSPGQPPAGGVPSIVADIAYPAVTYRHGAIPESENTE
jgi:hypothetical protein